MSVALISKLAKRNTFRNIRRTVLTVGLIACGLTALLFTDAIMRGSFKTMISISTDTFFGQAQVHRKGFREANDIDLYIDDTQRLYQTLNAIDEIEAYSGRVLAGAMLSSSQNVSSGIVYGVRPEHEAKISKVDDAMVSGSFLTGKDGEIVIGADMAELLEIGLGDRLVVTVSKAHGGELSQELFRVSGVFRFNDRNMDKAMAFVNLMQGQRILGVKGVHEVALKFSDIAMADDKTLPLWQVLNQREWEALNWRDLVPQLSGVLAMSDYSTWIVAVILYVLVALGLINSMFMSIYERHNEFGILLSIGTRPRQLFAQIIAEGFAIGLLSVVVGALAGTVVSLLVGINGISYEGTEMVGMTLNEPIYPIIDIVSFMQLSLSILLITVVSCLYPAAHAARLQPSLAMRKTL